VYHELQRQRNGGIRSSVVGLILLLNRGFDATGVSALTSSSGIDSSDTDVVRSVRPALVVNAGGQSRRMGQPKALLPVPPDDTPLLVHIVRRLLPLLPEQDPRVVIVINDAAMVGQLVLPMPVICVPDAWPETGTLGGIATALAQVDGWAMVVACDLPLVSTSLFARLLALASEQDPAGTGDRWDCIVPVVEGYEEPLHALYHRRCLPAIEDRLRQGERRVISFMPDVRTRRVHEEELRAVDPQLRSFVNANTPEEWAAALALLAQERGATA